MAGEDTNIQNGADAGANTEETPLFRTKEEAEAFVQRRAAGLAKEVSKRDQALAERDAKIKTLEESLDGLGKAKADLEGQLKALTEKLTEAQAYAERVEIFDEVYRPHLIDGVEPKHLPDAVYQRKDGKLTDEAKKAFEDFVTAKPSFARKSAGTPRATGNAPGGKAPDFLAVLSGRK